MLYINHGKEVYMVNILPETEVSGSLSEDWENWPFHCKNKISVSLSVVNCQIYTPLTQQYTPLWWKI